MPQAYDGEVLDTPPGSGAQPYTGEVLAAPPKTLARGDMDKTLGVAEGITSILSSGPAAAAGGLSGMAVAFARALGITDMEPADIVRKIQDGLTYQPDSKTGQAVAGAAAYPFEKLAEVADTAGQKTTDATGSPALGAAVNTGIQGAAQILGAKGLGVAGTALEATGKGLVRSALKTPLREAMKGTGERAVQTILDEGVNVSKSGAETLDARIDAINEKVKAKIQNSTAVVDKYDVVTRLDETVNKFKNQVSSTNDLAAIQRVYEDFMQNPLLPTSDIPVQTAQAMKQGTYRALGDKAYGELKGAEIEAQKALARGLKEEVANAVPEVRELNAHESKLIEALSLVERRAAVEAGKNPAGLGILSLDPKRFALWMADRSSAFKSLIGRMLYQSGGAVKGAAEIQSQALTQATEAAAGQRDKKKRREEVLRYIEEAQ